MDVMWTTSALDELVVTGTPYIVVYRLREKVEILAVVHGARDWPKRFDAP